MKKLLTLTAAILLCATASYAAEGMSHTQGSMMHTAPMMHHETMANDMAKDDMAPMAQSGTMEKPAMATAMNKPAMMDEGMMKPAMTMSHDNNKGHW